MKEFEEICHFDLEQSVGRSCCHVLDEALSFPSNLSKMLWLSTWVATTALC